MISGNLTFSSIFQLAALLVGSYLTIHGVVILLSQKTNRSTILFAILMVVMGAILLDHTYAFFQIFREFFQLMLWSIFYLFIDSLNKTPGFRWTTWAHFLIPLAWLTEILFDPMISPAVFEVIYLLQMFTYIIACLVKTQGMVRSQIIRNSYNPNYLNWIHYGLLSLLIVRLTLPVFISNAAVYELVFWIGLGIYMVGNTTFFIRSPHSVQIGPHLRKEEKVNYQAYIKRKLELVLHEQKAYLIPDLTLNELAIKAGMRSAELSGFFKTTMGKNFNDVINEYRIEDFKRNVTNPHTDPKATLMELAYASGFNSKPSFNRIFKRFTGMTPTEFKKSAMVTQTSA